MRVTITDLDHDSWAIERGVAEAEGVDFLFLGGGKDAGLDPRVKGSNGLLVQYADITAEVMDYLLPELKVIGRYGVGVDTIDLDAAEQRGIVVVNVPDYGTQEVSDHALGMMLCLTRKIARANDLVRQGAWDFRLLQPVRYRARRIGALLKLDASGPSGSMLRVELAYSGHALQKR